MGAGEKLTSPEVEADAFDVVFTIVLAGVLTGIGAGNGLGAGFIIGFETGFWRAAGTPCLIGVKRDLAGVGAGLATGFSTTGLAGALDTGAFADGDLVATATVRVFATDFAQTVTEVGPVLDE